MNVSGRNCQTAVTALTHEPIIRRILVNKLKTKIALATVLFVATSSAAFAQFDPNLANRYPGYAAPGTYGYVAGANGPSGLHAAPGATLQSAPVRLQQQRTTPTWTQNRSQHDRNVPGYNGDTSYGGDWMLSYGGGF
jgi:hypothetical protein